MIKLLIYAAVISSAVFFGMATKLMVLHHNSAKHVTFDNRKYDNDAAMFELADQVDQAMQIKHNGQVRCYALRNHGNPGLFIIDRKGILGVRRNIIKEIDSMFLAKEIHPVPNHPFPKPPKILLN